MTLIRLQLLIHLTICSGVSSVSAGPRKLLRREVRSVRNIRVHYCYLFPLLNLGHKLPSPILNAFGAIIQDVPCERFCAADDNNTLVLSSWIPALATGEATPTRAEGSIIEPNLAIRNVTHFNPLEPGVVVIMRNNTREYIGEVFDIYKKGLSGLSLRVYLLMQTDSTKIVYAGCDSDDDNDIPKVVAPHFTCRQRTFDLHTHASINHLVFNLGKHALVGDCGGACKLSLDAEKH
ncbi:hypothetical protein F4604DRAFT_1920684 [Suillus subluteus]|nr:hypothetical protein F4604DRAFT_1920684 [Suillus subluteus]